MVRSLLGDDVLRMLLAALIATVVLGADLVALAGPDVAGVAADPAAAEPSAQDPASEREDGAVVAAPRPSTEPAVDASGDADEDARSDPDAPRDARTTAAAPGGTAPPTPTAGADDTGPDAPPPSRRVDDEAAGSDDGADDAPDDSDAAADQGDEGDAAPASERTSATWAMGEDLPPCPEPGQGGHLFLDLMIDADAEDVTHTTSPALADLCPGTSIDADHALIPAGEPDPNHPDELPPSNAGPGEQVFRLYLTVDKPGDASQPGGQTPTLTVTVEWT